MYTNVSWPSTYHFDTAEQDEDGGDGRGAGGDGLCVQVRLYEHVEAVPVERGEVE